MIDLIIKLIIQKIKHLTNSAILTTESHISHILFIYLFDDPHTNVQCPILLAKQRNITQLSIYNIIHGLAHNTAYKTINKICKYPT